MKTPKWLYKAYCIFFDSDKFDEIAVIEAELRLRRKRKRGETWSRRSARIRKTSTEDLRRMLDEDD